MKMKGVKMRCRVDGISNLVTYIAAVDGLNLLQDCQSAFTMEHMEII